MWIISPVKDGLFFFGSTLAVFVVWAASAAGVNPFFILAGVAVASNGPHLVSTWTRAYFDRREWKEHPIAIFVVPALIVAAVAAITRGALAGFGVNGPRLLSSAILYWATWHFVAQNWGILRIYQRKSGEPLTSVALRLEKPILLLVVAWTLLRRVYTGPRVLFGNEVYFWVPPNALVLGLLAPIGILVTTFVALRLKDRQQPWARAAWLRAAFVCCAFLGFFVPFQLITSDDTSAFAAAAAWHGFQYLGIMRFYHRTTWRSGVEPSAKLISWLSQPGWGRALLYMALLWGLAGGVYGVIFALATLSPAGGWDLNTWMGVVWISLTLSHYWLDGVIWKLRKPHVAARVGIAQPA